MCTNSFGEEVSKLRKIEGYALIVMAVGADYQFLFGRGVNQERYENLSTNNITLFATIKEAFIAADSLMSRQDISSVAIAQTEMVIADSSEEWDEPEIRESKSLIVIWLADEDYRFSGRFVEGKPDQYPLPCADLCRNGFQPFLSFDGARYTAEEIARQSGGCSINLATFQIKTITSPQK